MKKPNKSWFHYVLALNALFSVTSCYLVHLKLYVCGSDLRLINFFAPANSTNVLSG